MHINSYINGCKGMAETQDGYGLARLLSLRDSHAVDTGLMAESRNEM